MSIASIQSILSISPKASVQVRVSPRKSSFVHSLPKTTELPCAPASIAVAWNLRISELRNRLATEGFRHGSAH